LAIGIFLPFTSWRAGAAVASIGEAADRLSLAEPDSAVEYSTYALVGAAASKVWAVGHRPRHVPVLTRAWVEEIQV
jgi:hypothetical protein